MTTQTQHAKAQSIEAYWNAMGSVSEKDVNKVVKKFGLRFATSIDEKSEDAAELVAAMRADGMAVLRMVQQDYESQYGGRAYSAHVFYV